MSQRTEVIRPAASLLAAGREVRRDSTPVIRSPGKETHRWSGAQITADRGAVPMLEHVDCSQRASQQRIRGGAKALQTTRGSNALARRG